MYKKLFSSILIYIYTITSPVAYPHESVSALRPPSGSNAGIDEAVAAKMSSAGYFYISIDFLEKLDNIVGAGIASSASWYAFLATSMTTEEIAIFEIVYQEHGADLAGEVREEISRRLEARRGLAGTHDNEKGQSPHKWPVRVTVKAEEIIIEQPGSAKPERSIPRKPAKAATEDKAQTEAADTVLSELDLPADKMRFRKVNDSKDTVVVTTDNKLVVINKANAVTINKAPVFASDTQKRFFIFGTEGKLCRFRFNDSQITTIIEGKRVYQVALSPDCSLLMIYFKESADVYNVNIYNIAEDTIAEAYKPINNVGKPKKKVEAISFSNDGKRLVLKNVGVEQPVAVDLASNTVVTAEAAKPVTKEVISADAALPEGPDVSSGKVTLSTGQELSVDDDAEKWLKCIRDITKDTEADLALINALFDEGTVGGLTLSFAGDNKKFIAVSEAIDAKREELHPSEATIIKRIKELNNESSSTEFTECAELAPNLEQLNLVEGTFNKKVEAKKALLLPATIDTVREAIKERKGQLGAKAKAKADTGEAGLMSLDTPAGSSEIHMAEDSELPDIPLDLPGVVGEAKAETVPKTPGELFEEAVKKFAKAMKIEEVNSIESKYLQLSQDKNYQGRIKAKARARRKWLNMLGEFSKDLNADMNQVAQKIERAPEESTKSWLIKKVWPEFVLLAKATRRGHRLDRFKKEAALYKEVKAVIEQKRRLFARWGNMIKEAKSLSLTAVNFAQLDKLEAKIKKAFAKMPACLAVPQIFIDKGRERLGKEQDKAKDKLKPLAGMVRKEYEKLHGLLEEFNKALRALDAAAEKRGFKDEERNVTKFPYFEAAGRVAIDYEYDAEGVRYEHQGKKWTRFFKLRQLRGPLKKAINKRYALLKQLRIYKRARKAIYDNYKLEDFLLGPKQTKEFGRVVNSLVSEGMEGPVAVVYNDTYSVMHILNYLAKIDNFLGQLQNKLIFVKVKTKKYIPVTNNTLNYIQGNVLKVEGRVDLKIFMMRHKPVSAAVVSESKVKMALDSQA